VIALRRILLAAVAAMAVAHPATAGPRSLSSLDGRPDAVIDLGTTEGVAAVDGQWRYRGARLVEADSRLAGPDLRPSGPPARTYDYTPRAGGPDFDDGGWLPIEPTALTARRGAGRLSFAWYRIDVTVPSRVGDLDPTGATVVFEVVVDDYAEVWVDGALSRRLGQRGGSLIGGFNAPNRVVVGRDVKPGQRIALAVFAVNGPLSDPPANYVWIRSATLDFYRAPRFPSVPLRVDRADSALDAIVPPGAVAERLADGFEFTEGPVWVREGSFLMFSDPDANTIYSWSSEAGVAVYRAKSGYTGVDIGAYRQPGANGLTLDRDGRLVMNEHGNRRVTRLERNGVLTVLADRHQGRRLNSPNDLVHRSDGTLYFTDPPFGLPGLHGDARRELPWSGVFRYAAGTLTLESTELTGPNGLAFSPDEAHLYVTNWDAARKVVVRYDVAADGRLSNGRVFFDMTTAPGEAALDGVKVDRQGNLYVSGPGGLWIVSAAGVHLGTIRFPEPPSNFAWGDEDGRTLYVTARTSLYRVRLGVPGIRP
jgi:gluconolactonase